MKIIKTKSFELATFSRGNENSKKLALLLPGRLDTKDYINFVSHADYLANRGFYVVAIDPPATWDSPGEINLYTTTNYIKAVNELIEYFGNKPTLLLGHSRGAAVSVFVGMSNPHVIGIVVVMANYGIPTAPSTEALQTGFQISHRDLPPGASKTKEQKDFLLPISYWDDEKNYNAAESLKKCTKPKLLVYGTKDEFTPTDDVEELYKIIPDPKMIKLVDSSHDYRYYPEVIKETEEAIDQFLTTHSI